MATLIALLGVSQVNLGGVANLKKFIGPCGKKGHDARGTDKLTSENGKLLPVAFAGWGLAESL